MSKKTTHGGRTLYLNPEKSAIEAELDAVLRATDRAQPLMRSFLLAGYALYKEGITWDSINNRLAQGNKAVTWQGAESTAATPLVLRTTGSEESPTENEKRPPPPPVKRKFAAFIKGS